MELFTTTGEVQVVKVPPVPIDTVAPLTKLFPAIEMEVPPVSFPYEGVTNINGKVVNM